MTQYEVCALVLSIIAILIPIVQWIWRKWIIRPELKFYSTGRAYLFANKSGSYIRIEGVFEALNKPISIKNISLKVIRMKDDAALNLRWGTFINPANQQILGAVASVSEIAHPFRIDANNVVCAFAEYIDFYDSSSKTLQPWFEDIVVDLNKMDFSKKNYPDILIEYNNLDSYKNAREALFKEMFWEIGKYEIEMDVEYGKTNKVFRLDFEVSKDNYMDLNYNIDEVLASFLKNRYQIQSGLRTVQVEVEEDK